MISLETNLQGTFEYPFNVSQYSADIHTVRLEVNGEVFTKIIVVKFFE